MSASTDTAALESKLELRRYFLDKYHAKGEVRVFDACQGEGLIWKTLRAERKLKAYWGVDTRAKKGRLSVDSARVLAITSFRDNVVDVDADGSPWAHWLALLPNIKRPTTVFLTVGGVSDGATYHQFGKHGAGIEVLAALGLGGMKHIHEANVKAERLTALAIPALIFGAEERARVKIVEAKKHRHDVGKAWYYGVHLKPRK